MPRVDLLQALPENGGTWILSGDASGLGVQLAHQLTRSGSRCHFLFFPPSLVQSDAAPTGYPFTQLDEGTLHSMEATVRDMASQVADIVGWIHIHPQFTPGHAASITDVFVEQDLQLSKLVFFVAKNLAAVLGRRTGGKHGGFYSVTRMGGHLGMSTQEPFSIMQGALPGLTKSLAKEFDDLRTKSIDISHRLPLTDQVGAIWEEVFDADPRNLEIGIDEKLQRWRPALAQREAVPTSHLIGQDSVCLITGGGRGITADCAIELAKRHKAKFILVGRTSLAYAEPEWAKAAQSEQALQQAAIQDDLRQGLKPKPSEINRAIKNILSVRAIRQNIRQLEQQGSQVLYLSLDIMDPACVSRELQQAQRQFGPVDVLIHGAGNLADKKIQHKSEEDFESVFGTKLRGLEHVLAAIDPARLKHLLLYSSVSGYFGNKGQADYAMANEALNKFAFCFRHFFPQCNVRAINWGPWDSGMVHGALKEAYKDRGIKLISREEGATWCADELSSDPCVVQVLLTETEAPLPETPAVVPGSYKVTRRLSLQDNPFLLDHQVSGHPVLPATCAIQWAVACCSHGVRGHHLLSIDDFKVFKGVIFNDPDPVELTATVRIVPPSAEVKEVVAHVDISGMLANGRACPHYQATIRFSAERPAVVPLAGCQLDVAPSTAAAPSLYGEGAPLFHGETFQGVRQVLHLSEERILVKCRLPRPPLSVQGQFRIGMFDPFTADVQLQISLVFSRHQFSIKCLPTEIRSIQLYKTLPFDKDYFVSGRLVQRKGSVIEFAVEVFDENRECYQKWAGVKNILKAY